MTERLTDKRTIVGIPFYDGEGIDVLDACLTNLDLCLNNLGVDAEVVVGINGPRVLAGENPLSYDLDRSKYNATVRFVKTPPGLVNAEKTLARHAREEGYSRMFLTDADISRLPNSMRHLWEEGDRQVNGCSYSAYPIDIVTGAGIDLSPQEIAFMRIFEADKHPLAREFTTRHRPKTRLKGSLLLVDTAIVKSMFGTQGITSDSRMNRLVSDGDRKLVPHAAFMHYARVDVTDHIQGRLRHFRAAAAVQDLDVFTRKSIMYDPETADDIAHRIVQKYPQATDVASDFLLQCALRYKVADIGRTIAGGNTYQPDTPSNNTAEVTTLEVSSFYEAVNVMTDILGHVDLSLLDSPVTKGNGVTSSDQFRVPINLAPPLQTPEGRSAIYSHLGLMDDIVI